MTPINNILSPSFFCHKISVRFYPVDEIRMDVWIGAVIRNNFLYAAENVYDKHGQSLRQKIDDLPLPDNHPYYKQFLGGTPKGLFFDCSDIPYVEKGIRLEKNHIYTIHFILAGSFSEYYLQVIEAIRSLFSRGFGHPMTPATIIDIFETTDDEQHHILYSDNCNFLNTPSHSIKLADYYQEFHSTNEKRNLTLQFVTPVSLIHPRTKVNKEISYQDKLNCFPSFYQFMRSVAYRLMTLNLLYGKEVDITDQQTTEAALNVYIEAATEAILLQANISNKRLYSTPRKEQSSVYVMNGYQGTITWGNVDSKYVPLLIFASHLGVGNDINFGLGIFTCRLT